MGEATVGQFSPVLSCLGGEVVAAKLFTLFSVQTAHFYLNRVLESLLGKAGLLQILSFLRVSAQVSTLLGFPQLGLREAVAVSQAPAFSVAFMEVGLSAYRPMHVWVSLHLGPLAYGARSYNSHRDIFIHGLMPN